MSAVIQASGLGKKYGRTWALRDCTLAVPEGHRSVQPDHHLVG